MTSVSRSLVLALLLAALAGAATFAALHRAARDGSAVPLQQYVVAARPIALGARLAGADVRLVSAPASAIPADAIRGIDAAIGRYAAFPLPGDAVLLRSQTSEQPPGGSMAAVIPADRVAVSVAVSDVISTGGFIAPGDHVDVLGVTSKETGAMADLVLSDVPVLAVSSTVVGSTGTPQRNERAGGGSANPRALDTTVTLAVTVSEAQRLVQVDENGKLRLVLRPRLLGITAR